MTLNPNFTNTPDGLLPAIIQDASTGKVLMLGYMNEESYRRTLDSGMVTFYSRSRQRIWMKGEESGNVLRVVSIQIDCDGDTFLIQAHPAGPVCHTGADTCWNEANNGDFLDELAKIIHLRKLESPEVSYTARLVSKGIHKVAQKVGEEAVETVIESLRGDRDRFIEESADLMFHWLVLCDQMGIGLDDIRSNLRSRHQIRTAP